MSGKMLLLVGALACLAVVALVALAVVYVRFIRGNLSTYAEAIGKSDQLRNAEGVLDWLRVKTRGWRTIALSAVAALAQVPAFLDYWLPQVHDLPWSSVVDAKVANGITLACAFLIPLVHAAGLAKAATTYPQGPA